MSKTASGLIAHCKEAVKNNVQYIYGAKMEILTYSQILALQNLYGKSYVWDSDLNKAGKICCDCSGLISSYTGIVRTSGNFRSTATASVSIAEVKANWSEYIGWGFWLSGHVGVVSDTEGCYYAMDGSARNMVHYPISKQSWIKAIKLCDIDYMETKTEDCEVIDTTSILVNGTEHTINRILKDSKNYICLADLANMGFDIGYDSTSKIPSLANTLKNIRVQVDGEEKSLEAVNISGYNFCRLRDVAEITGVMDTDYSGSTVIIKTKV